GTAPRSRPRAGWWPPPPTHWPDHCPDDEQRVVPPRSQRSSSCPASVLAKVPCARVQICLARTRARARQWVKRKRSAACCAETPVRTACVKPEETTQAQKPPEHQPMPVCCRSQRQCPLQRMVLISTADNDAGRIAG